MIHIWTDGACDQTGTKAGGWAALVDVANTTPMKFSGAVRNTTNNRMELEAIVHGLEEAAKRVHLDSSVAVHTDSELIVKQRHGEYQIKGNKDLNHKIDVLVRALSQDKCNVIWIWHPRNSHEYLKWADKEAVRVRKSLDDGPMRRLKSKYNPQ